MWPVQYYVWIYYIVRRSAMFLSNVGKDRNFLNMHNTAHCFATNAISLKQGPWNNSMNFKTNNFILSMQCKTNYQ